ncbi:acetyl-CoA synthetase-like protein [Cucurbitaria berberidis CBS 394.84]|uniref:Acetyl-CoA synthetase-like protein n=1 Tax=Cucurbitaria berberidis CBS 394.84 TaxID=1168544 RepID=A0A9P4GID5_9PLEO|nr:acetyl-CoA synthetase-like protein [Cucurbitaria berberidis CBS 394.84]KAF1846733.1 acetyl-CoA synthetase-like protein [Cucurbitaria berberidis CBS 394.84]
MTTQTLSLGLTGLASSPEDVLTRFGHGPKLPVPHSLVHEAFENIADVHPTAIAARFGADTITYEQLDIAANRLAHYLINSGLKPRQRVCLVVQRSFEMLIGLFAILKAGCQYVPIDGGVTSEKALQHIFADTEARFILCLPRFWDKIRQFARKDAIIVALETNTGAFYSTERPTIEVTSADGAYAIYTSGSTGKPKGVDVSHGNVTNALLLEPAKLGITIGAQVAQVLNIAFDMGAWEILACLMNGGTLWLRGSDWKTTLREIDTLISTPSILSNYRRASFPNIRTVVTGGEPCPQALADEWAQGTSYLNICGPTEITILNSAHRHVPGTPLTIGKPLPNTTCYILNDDGQPVPFGEKGVMWVGGAGVSRGYINLPELSSERYQLDRFANDGSKMFCTGDIVRWSEDGCLETFGRVDDQVKIKGFRVELDGVTSVIEKFPGVTRASAIIIDNVFHGFYTTQTLIDEEDLDAFVRKHLPYYSVPECWTYVESIPLTANGKVDRKGLGALVLRHTKQDSAVDTSLSIQPTPKCTTLDLYQPASHNADVTRDPEKGQDPEKAQVTISSKLSDSGLSSKESSIVEIPDTLPEKNGFHGQRWFRHRLFILYRRFFSVVIAANLIAACFILYRRIKFDRYILADLATATAANLCIAVLMRSEPVVNLLFTVFCSVPTSFPLAIRRHCARIFHIGGIHSGCAIAAMVWFTFFTIGASVELTKPLGVRCISVAPVVLSYLVVAIFFAMGSMSHPTIRAKYHNIWEMTHRFGGWTALLLLWIQTFLATKDLNPDIAPTKAWLNSPPIWLLTIATMAIIFPWLFLRKVLVRSEVLSNHAVRLWFNYTTPVVGTSVRLAERPLLDWHGFATITNEGPNPNGFSLIVSRAGDFTGRTIERAPTHIWVRGIPTCGVLRIATLFRSVVLVATGSGIGPCLAVILARKVPCRILWTAPNPEQTFGKDIVESVMKTDPHAVIHNTRTQGKPNMSLMAYKLYKESGAEAVCVISNKRFTTKIVYDMECRGIPAYGAIFDS